MNLIRSFKRYLVLYGIFVRYCIMPQMEYRFNFLMSSLVQLAYIVIKITYVIVIYNVGIPIKGVTPDQMMIFIGTYSALSGVFVSFFLINFGSISHQVRTGDLDLLIVKPVSLQFLVTLRRVDIGFALVSVPIGGVMIAMGWVRAGVPASLTNILGFLFFTILGLFITYSFFLIPNILAFWIISNNGLTQVVGQLWDFNNMPMIVYPNIIRIIGLFIFPVFLITNIGALFILDMLDPLLILWSILTPVLLFIISRMFWNFAEKRYSSASS